MHDGIHGVGEAAKLVFNDGSACTGAEAAADGIDVGGLPPPWFLLDDGDKDAEADDRIRLSGLGDLGGVLAVGVDGLRGACVTGEAKPE